MRRSRRLLFVDDHPLIRDALRDKGWEVLDEEAGDGNHALERARSLSPAVVIVDISLPGTSGLEVTRRVKQACPDAQVVVLSVHLETKHVVEAFEAGASGYVSKCSAVERLFECLDAIADGNVYVDPTLSGSVVEGLLGSRAGSVSAGTASRLTAREQEVVRLLVQGLSTREVGERLFISSKTADNHRANIMKKLHLNGIVDLVRYAGNCGLIDFGAWKEPLGECNPGPRAGHA